MTQKQENMMKHRILILLIPMVFALCLLVGCTPTEHQDAGTDIQTPELQPGGAQNGTASGSGAAAPDAQDPEKPEETTDGLQAPQTPELNPASGSTGNSGSASTPAGSEQGGSTNPSGGSGTNPGGGTNPSGNTGSNPGSGRNPSGNTGGASQPAGEDEPFSTDPDELPIILADDDEAPSGDQPTEEDTADQPTDGWDGGDELPIIPIN